ncbi:MAG TPA: DUF2905 domain-containing protein [Nitrospirota bacterium]|nr:DUF2905 domain-containing protein [Nitrospirota bacterium]
MHELAKTLIVLGALLVAAGLVLLAVQKLPSSWKIPGDIVVKREHFSFYFPLGTSILLSIILSVILYLIGKFR